MLRLVLKRLGKSERRVAAVFADSPEWAQRLVLHIRSGAPGLPIHLYMTAPPFPQAADWCERIHVHSSSSRLLLAAEAELWRRSVSLTAASWNGGSGRWLVKIAPLVIPPFRTLFVNENGDFLAGTPANLWRHGKWVAERWTKRRRDALRDCLIRLKDVAYATAIAGTGRVLQAFGNPHRPWFERRRAFTSLQISHPASVGTTVAVYDHSGQAWDAESIETFARTASARWILWRQDAAGAIPSDLFGPFQEEQAFAASVQTHYRAWKPSLAPMAPFRTLPPGVAARVLAPLSNAILVDRQKLLALGIPRCSLAGTAWLILFWKAAAAGWRAYSVGQNGPVCEQPDFPSVEAEFLLHTLWRKELRALGPAEADLSRGNIAFHPRIRHARAENGGRTRVLVVSPFLPYPLSHGGAVRMYNLCRALSHRVDFALAAIRESRETVDYQKLHEVFDTVRIVDLDERPCADQRLPAQVRHYQSRNLRALISQLAREWRPDLLQIEYTQMAAFRQSAPETPAILVEHDITFQLYRQLAGKSGDAEAWREYGRWLDFESQWLRNFDSVWTVCDDDRWIAIEQGSDSASTVAVPNGVDTQRFLPGDAPADRAEVLFVGSFRHLPNVLGFQLLCREIMPAVWQRHPDARLRCVAGPRAEEYWRSDVPLDPRIEMQGYVEDLRPLYAQATVVAVPLEVSAGTNIKVLEAMACAKAIVTTPAGCAGLELREGHDALIRSGAADFAHAICALLSNPAGAKAMGRRARQTAERRFAWPKIADRAHEAYQHLVRRTLPRRHASAV